MYLARSSDTCTHDASHAWEHNWIFWYCFARAGIAAKGRSSGRQFSGRKQSTKKVVSRAEERRLRQEEAKRAKGIGHTHRILLRAHHHLEVEYTTKS